VAGAVIASAGLLATAVLAAPLRSFLGLAAPTPASLLLIGGAAAGAVLLSRVLARLGAPGDAVPSASRGCRRQWRLDGFPGASSGLDHHARRRVRHGHEAPQQAQHAVEALRLAYAAGLAGREVSHGRSLRRHECAARERPVTNR